MQTLIEQAPGKLGVDGEELRLPPDGIPGRAFFNPWRVGLCVLFVLSIALYWSSLTGQLIWDDHIIVEYHRDGANSLWGVLTGHFLSYYRPLTGASYYLDGALFGPVAFNYHVTNILIHAFGCVAVAWAGWTLFEDRVAGIAAGLLFALQPAQVATTAWIGGRTDDLSCLFIALFVGSVVRYVKSGNRVALGLSVAAFFCALMTKEQNLPFLVAAPIAGYLFGENRERRLKPLWLSFGGATLAFLILLLLEKPDTGNLSHTPFLVTLERVGETSLHYALFFLVPGPIGLVSFSLGRYENFASVMVGWIVFIGLFAGLAIALKRNRAMAFVLAGLLLAFLPISNVVPIPSLLVGPYRVAVAGVFVALGTGFAISYSWRCRRPVLLAAASANLLLGAYSTALGIGLWKSEPVFFRAVVANDPWSLIGESMNTHQFLDNGNGAGALQSTEVLLDRVYGSKAWEDPSRIDAISGPGSYAWTTIEDNAGTRAKPPVVLGNYLLLRSEALRVLKRDSESLPFALAAERMDPTNGDAHAAVGDLLIGKDRAAAVHEHELAVRYSPASWQYLRRLANERYEDGRYAEAAALFRKATHYAGWFGGVWIGLSDSLAAMGDRQGALAALDSAQKGLVMNQKEIDRRRAALMTPTRKLGGSP